MRTIFCCLFALLTLLISVPAPAQSPTVYQQLAALKAQTGTGDINAADESVMTRSPILK